MKKKEWNNSPYLSSKMSQLKSKQPEAQYIGLYSSDLVVTSDVTGIYIIVMMT